MHFAILQVTLLPFCNWRYSSNHLKWQTLWNANASLDGQEKISQVRLRPAWLASKPIAFWSSLLWRSYLCSSVQKTNFPQKFSPLPPLPRTIFSGNLASLQGVQEMIIGGNKNSSLHSFIFPSLNSFILHRIICIRTLSNFLQKESFIFTSPE
jgi:hypothetical protein